MSRKVPQTLTFSTLLKNGNSNAFWMVDRYSRKNLSGEETSNNSASALSRILIKDRVNLKLAQQLEPAPPETKRLWAEMTWVLFLNRRA